MSSVVFDRTAASAAAQEGFRQAWCDGPPFAYHSELEKSKRLLVELGAPFPDPPPRDTSFDDLRERSAALEAQILA